MAKNKTTFTEENVEDFINSFSETQQKVADSMTLLALFEELTGEKAKMWGTSIIGFGSYQYKYASGHSGDAPILGFSPRKAATSLYIYSDTAKSKDLLIKLGKYKMGKACIYVNKLADIDINVLEELCKETIQYLNSHYECSCKRN